MTVHLESANRSCEPTERGLSFPPERPIRASRWTFGPREGSLLSSSELKVLPARDGHGRHGPAVPANDATIRFGFQRKSCIRVDTLGGVSDEAALKTPFERALIRNLRMLNRYLWELRGEVSMSGSRS